MVNVVAYYTRLSATMRLSKIGRIRFKNAAHSEVPRASVNGFAKKRTALSSPNRKGGQDLCFAISVNFSSAFD